MGELQRAKRASEAPGRENLVMTSPYDILRPYRLFGRGRGVSVSPAISVFSINMFHTSIEATITSTLGYIGIPEWYYGVKYKGSTMGLRF